MPTKPIALESPGPDLPPELFVGEIFALLGEGAPAGPALGIQIALPRRVLQELRRSWGPREVLFAAYQALGHALSTWPDAPTN